MANWCLWVNGKKVNSAEQIKENFNISDIRGYYLGGSLVRWLYESGEDELARKIEAIPKGINPDKMLFDIFCKEYKKPSYHKGVNQLIPLKNPCSFINGSYKPVSFRTGSMRIGKTSFKPTSYKPTSFKVGSYRITSHYHQHEYEYEIGSYNIGSYALGSYLFGYNFGSYNSGSYRFGYNFGSYSFGSYRFGSYNLGSYRHIYEYEYEYGIGSYRVGSYTLYGSRLVKYSEKALIDFFESEPLNRFGYGIHLI